MSPERPKFLPRVWRRSQEQRGGKPFRFQQESKNPGRIWRSPLTGEFYKETKEGKLVPVVDGGLIRSLRRR